MERTCHPCQDGISYRVYSGRERLIIDERSRSAAMNADRENLLVQLLIPSQQLAAFPHSNTHANTEPTSLRIRNSNFSYHLQTHWSVISQPYLGICNFKLFTEIKTNAWGKLFWSMQLIKNYTSKTPSGISFRYGRLFPCNSVFHPGDTVDNSYAIFAFLYIRPHNKGRFKRKEKKKSHKGKTKVNSTPHQFGSAFRFS